MVQGMQAGSYDVRNYLGKLSEVREEHDAEKDKRRLDMELKKVAAQNSGNLDVQKVANEGSTNVATINNTGAMDRTIEQNKGSLAVQTASDTAQAGVRQAQAGYFGKHGDFLGVQGKVMQDEAPFKSALMKSQTSLINNQSENQGITNTLAKKWGDQRMQAEIQAQKLGVAKIGMEYDMLGQAFDKTNADNAMQSAQNYYNHPDNQNQRLLADWNGEQQTAAAAAPKPEFMWGSQADAFSDKVLGKPGTIGQIIRNVPFAGMAYSYGRARKAYSTLQNRASGVAKP